MIARCRAVAKSKSNSRVTKCSKSTVWQIIGHDKLKFKKALISQSEFYNLESKMKTRNYLLLNGGSQLKCRYLVGQIGQEYKWAILTHFQVIASSIRKVTKLKNPVFSLK